MKHFIVFIILQLCLIGISQSKKELELKRLESIKAIERSNSLLRQTEKSKKAELNTLVIVSKQIKAREELITNINKELVAFQLNIDLLKLSIAKADSDLQVLKADYAKIIYLAQRNRNLNLSFMYILSAGSFSEAYMKMKYVKQYLNYRAIQGDRIVATKNELIHKRSQLIQNYIEKANLMHFKSGEKERLLIEQDERNVLLQKLQKKEDALRAEIKNNEIIAQKLKEEIAKVIAQEAKKSGKTLFDKLTPEEKIVSKDFARNKGKLPWPTEKGEITGFFGEHEHPVLKGIKVNNQGVDITSVKNAIVRSVFGGVVSKVVSIKGANFSVIIRHGNFLTVYSNLSQVTVRNGDKVSIKQQIGVIYSEPGDLSASMQFQIWEELKKQDPQLWLTRK